MDIRTSSHLDFYQWQVVVERQSDLGPTEYQVIFCTDEAEATAAMVQALKNCPDGYTCSVSSGPIGWRGQVDKR